MNFTRRHFLKTGGVALGTMGLGLFPPPMLRRHLLAADPNSNKKLIFVFQRGGNDGLNTLIPRGDSDYSTSNRPSLFIPENQAIDTGNGFAQLHPQLQPLMEVYNHTTLNGQPGPGSVAIMHRIGYADQSRSHFSSQQYWENGTPGDDTLEEGMLYRHLDKTLDLDSKDNAFVAASLSSGQLVSLKGPNALPNFSRASNFTLGGSGSRGDKFLGQLPSTEGGTDGSGLLGLYGASPDEPGKAYRNLIHGTGELLGATFETINQALAQGDYTPENGAIYPDGSFGRKLMEAAMLMKRTPVRCLGINIGGWDTHSDQGQINGDHGSLLSDVATGIQALYRDLQSQWDDLLVITMTEFGRTSKENNSRGTDHAASSVVFAAGGGVNGGIYNCDSSTWEDGAMFSARSRYVRRKTDFRAIFAEMFIRHFGDDAGLMNEIIPGYDEAKANEPQDFQFLNYLV